MILQCKLPEIQTCIIYLFRNLSLYTDIANEKMTILHTRVSLYSYWLGMRATYELLDLKVKHKIFTFWSTNSYVARILVNNCFVKPFTWNIWLNNVCNAALRIIPNALNFDYFRFVEFEQKLISCNVATKRFQWWTGRPINIENVRPFELKFGFF